MHIFEAANALPTLNPAIVLAGAASSDVGGEVEWDLDSQTIQSVAGGTVRSMTFYVATSFSSGDLIAAFNAAVSAGVAKVINVSIGGCETYAQSEGAVAAADQIFELAVAQGQTFSISSGDYGSAECGNAPGQSWPAISPYVIAVGGTLLTKSGSGYLETAWSGGGGGPSQTEGKPLWQAAAVPGTQRGVPDVAFDASPESGVLLTSNGKPLGPVGGTSLASPIFVGLFARLQTISRNALPFPNELIYDDPPVARSRSFNDVVSGSNGAYQAAVGWDFTTGFGSLSAQNFGAGITPLSLAPVVTYLLANPLRK